MRARVATKRLLLLLAALATIGLIALSAMPVTAAAPPDIFAKAPDLTPPTEVAGKTVTEAPAAPGGATTPTAPTTVPRPRVVVIGDSVVTAIADALSREAAKRGIEAWVIGRSGCDLSAADNTFPGAKTPPPNLCVESWTAITDGTVARWHPNAVIVIESETWEQTLDRHDGRGFIPTLSDLGSVRSELDALVHGVSAPGTRILWAAPVPLVWPWCGTKSQCRASEQRDEIGVWRREIEAAAQRSGGTVIPWDQFFATADPNHTGRSDGMHPAGALADQAAAWLLDQTGV